MKKTKLLLGIEAIKKEYTSTISDRDPRRKKSYGH